MQIPVETRKVIAGERSRNFDPEKAFVVDGTWLNAVAVLAVRFNHPFKDANEKRDWQNLLNLMLDRVEPFEI